MRSKPIPLISQKLATKTPAQKAMPSTGIPHEDMYFIDPVCLYTAFMNSDIADSMHKGMAEFHDLATELHHSRCWSTSVRTTSGEYAHNKDGSAIFPSDFVTFTCFDEECACMLERELHIGRVLGVGRFFQTDPHIPPGSVVLEIREAYDYTTLADDDQFDAIEPPVHKQELILSAAGCYVPEDHIIDFVDVVLDHSFGERKLQDVTAFHIPVRQYFLRRVMTKWDSFEEMLPLCQTHPIRAELEIHQFGRTVFEQDWDVQKNNKCLSVPLLTFIDGFGLYRNSYRSLMGFYQTPAGT
jgi:hypothetical protein